MKSSQRLEVIFRTLLATIMVTIGIQHFRSPVIFERIVPAYLPAHRLLVLISGFFEVAGGVGLIIPQTRRAAAWGLIALYIAVFPANINMVVHPDPHYGPAAIAALWARLPLQFVLIAWAYWFTAKPQRSDHETRTRSITERLMSR